MEKLMELGAIWGSRVAFALVLLAAGWIASKTIRRYTRRALGRSKIEPTLIPFISGVVYYGLLIFVVLAALAMLGIETTSFIAVLGAAGLAVGLALQGTLTNFASGVMLLVFRPFKVGDYVEVGGSSGSVQEVGIFSTGLHSADNVRIVVPNSSVWGSVIKNYSANDNRRNDLSVGVAYGDDLGLAKATIDRVLSEDPRVLRDPEPVVAVSELADSAVNFVVRPWCRREDYWSLRFDLTRKLKEELEAAGCSIPFPQRDVHVHQVRDSAA